MQDMKERKNEIICYQNYSYDRESIAQNKIGTVITNQISHSVTSVGQITERHKEGNLQQTLSIN